MTNKKDLQFAVVSTDVILLRNNSGIIEYATQIVNRKPYYINLPALIGGVLKPEETALEADKRIIKEKAGYSSNSITYIPIGFYDAVNRDKRNRVVSLAHMGIMNSCEEKEGIVWNKLYTKIKLAYDHNHMLEDVQKYLKDHLFITVISLYFMEEEFTIGELQTLYEYILQKKVDKRNFYKFIDELPISATEKMKQEGRGRPAVIYKKKYLKDFLLK